MYSTDFPKLLEAYITMWIGSSQNRNASLPSLVCYLIIISASSKYNVFLLLELCAAWLPRDFLGFCAMTFGNNRFNICASYLDCIMFVLCRKCGCDWVGHSTSKLNSQYFYCVRSGGCNTVVRSCSLFKLNKYEFLVQWFIVD